MPKKFIYILLICSLACKKEYKEYSLETDDKVVAATVGTLFNNSVSYPAYWLDNKLFYLENPTKTAYAFCIEKSNSNFVIGGSYSKLLTPQYEVIKPCYWINNKQYELPTYKDSANGFIVGIKERNENIYFYGSLDSMPIIWKLNKGNIDTIHLPLPNEAIAPIKYNINIKLVNNKLIICNTCYLKTIGNAFARVPIIWEIDENNKVKYTIVDNDLNIETVAYDFDVTQNEFYIIGAYKNLGSTDYKSCVWTKKGRINTDQLFGHSIIPGSSTIKLNDNGNIFLSIGNVEKKTITINYLNSAALYGSQPNPILINLPIGYEGYCTSIDTKYNKPVFCIKCSKNAEYFMFLQKNGKYIPLEFNPGFSLGEMRVNLFDR